MKKIFKPRNREELKTIIKEIVTNQLSETSYSYGLKDVDTSLIKDLSYLFSCYVYNENYKINSKINWDDHRNSIVNWNVSSVTTMDSIFYKSNFNQNLSKWIFTLNRNCNLSDFNFNSIHEKKFNRISSYEDFISKQLTKQFIDNIIKNGSDKEKFQLLKIIKQYPDIVKNLNIERELL